MSATVRPEHPWSDDVAPYLLDALEPEARARFEAHLRECARCQAEVAEMREVTDLLAFGAPPAAPPPALRERVLSEARQVRPISAAPLARRRERPIVPWLATAASLLLALLTGRAYWEERQDRLALQEEFARVRVAVAERDSLLGALLAPEVRTLRLTATGQAPSVRLFWNREQRLLVLTAADLPPTSPGRTYQLWGIVPGRSPVSLGTFEPSRDGTARAVLPLPEDLAFSVSAVTEEPAGGSPQPTTEPFLVGEWSAGE